MGSFSHPQETKRVLAQFLLTRNSSPIVADRQKKFAVLSLHLNDDSRRLRMTKDVS
jgi:hypothetical protein